MLNQLYSPRCIIASRQYLELIVENSNLPDLLNRPDTNINMAGLLGGGGGGGGGGGLLSGYNIIHSLFPSLV